MNKKTNEKFICEKCGKEFDAEIYTSVDESLRSEVLSLDIYKHTCPHCHESSINLTPLCYSDNEKQFMILLNNYLELENTKNDYLKQASIFSDFSKLFKEFQIVGVTNPRELVEAIVILENKLDYRMTKVLIKIVESEFIDYMKNEGLDYVHYGSYLMYDEANNLNIEFLVDNQGEKGTFMVPLDDYKELYENIYNNYYDELYKIDSLIFNSDTARKFVNFIGADEEIKKSRIKLALCICEDGYFIYSNILNYNFNKYKEGDILCVCYNDEYLKVKIVKLIDETIEKSFVDPTEIATTMWLYEPKILNQTGDDIDDLDNSELLNGLKIFTENDYNITYFPDELVMTSDVIAAKMVENIKNDDQILAFDVRTIEDRKYMCVYLDKNHLPQNNDDYKIFSFNDTIEFIISNPDSFNGVIINPDDEEIILDIKTLSFYKRNRYMSDPKRMINLLEHLTEDEIEYMTKESYDVICKVYFEDKTPVEIAVEMNKKESEIHKLLGEGYKAMICFVQENY